MQVLHVSMRLHDTRSNRTFSNSPHTRLLSWNHTAHHSSHKSLAMISIFSQLNLVHNLTTIFLARSCLRVWLSEIFRTHASTFHFHNACYVSSTSYPSWCDHSNSRSARWIVHIMKPLSRPTQFPPILIFRDFFQVQVTSSAICSQETPSVFVPNVTLV
jgi:hypothetical protein